MSYDDYESRSHVLLLARRTRYDVARLSVSAGGLLGVYKSCRERNGQLSSERADGREELRRIRSAVNTHDGRRPIE